MKAIEQCFNVVLFITLFKEIITFNSVDKTLVCDYSRKKAIEHYFHVVLRVKVSKETVVLRRWG